MRLAINGYFLDQVTTGSGQYTYHLLRELEALWPGDITVIVPTRTLPSYPESTKVHYQRVNVALPGHLGKLWFEHVSVPRAAQEAGADLLHVPYLGPPLQSTVPFVVTVHDLIQLVVPQLRGGLHTRIYNRLAVSGACRARALLVDSEHTRQTVLAQLKVDPERVHRVYLGVEPHYTPTSELGEHELLREHYGLSEPFLFYLGGLDWRKNVALLIRAYARSGVTMPLVITGKPRSGKHSSFPDLEREAQACGVAERVRFLGWVPEEDKPALYRAAFLFVFPSLYEGFGLPPLEALACGAAVLCSNASSLPEVTGDAALLFDPTNETGLANLLQQTTSDPGLLNALAVKGPEQAARFSWHKTAQDTLAVYEHVLGMKEAVHG